MQRWIVGLALVSAVGAAFSAERIVESRTLRESVALEAGQAVTLCVDNIFGSIRVTAHDRPLIEMIAEETIEARSQSALERARAEVRLDVGREGDEVTMVVDGPFRDRDGRCCDHDWRGYTVSYDFEIRVPTRTHLELKTVNSGEVEVRGVRGHLSVSNVNGGITLEAVGGSVEATTVNGPVRASFDENPTGDSSFHTVNGDLELSLQPGLSADLRFKTWNGEALTDFDVVPLALEPAQEEIDGGRRVIRSPSWSSVRVERGGPQLSFETLNGDIRIRNARRAAAASR